MPAWLMRCGEVVFVCAVVLTIVLMCVEGRIPVMGVQAMWAAVGVYLAGDLLERWHKK